MNNKDILQLCFGNLLRRRTRTILSVIGVIIGTTAIIVMLSIGIGLSYGYQEQLESFGNLHMIEVYNYGGGGGGGSGGQSNKLDDRTIAKIEKIDGVTVASPQVSQYVVIAGDHKRTERQIVGIRSEMLQAMNLEVEKGRMINSSDKNGLLFGKVAAASFYDPRKQQGMDWSNTEPTVDPLQKFVLTNDWDYGTNQEGQNMNDVPVVTIEAQGVGMMASSDNEYAYNIYTTIEFAQKVKEEFEKAQNGGRPTGGNQGNEYSDLMVYVENLDKVASVSETIRTDYGFGTYSLNDMLKEMQKTANMIEAVLGGIGGISLLVAAIGIALSYAISYVMNHFLSGALGGFGMGSRVSIIPIWLVLAALAFSTLVGVVSGYSPAQRAMNMSVLEGLKNE